MYNFLFYFLMFIIFSMIGWIVEVIYVYIIDKDLVNRGYLIGPYIPIYGTCGVLMVLLLNGLYKYPLLIFILAMLLCSTIEYLTSYILEKVFNARWWDYSNQKYNLNGRICLLNAFLFGVLAIILIYLVNPFVTNILTNLDKKRLEIISLVCLTIFTTDFIVSTKVAFNLKDKFSSFKSDATIEIKKLISTTLKNNYLSKRFYEAFPKYKITKYKTK